MHYKYHKVNFQCGRSYVDYPDWLKSKKATINPINKNDDKWFQYTVFQDGVPREKQREIFNELVNERADEIHNF